MTIVIKCGGSILNDVSVMRNILSDISTLYRDNVGIVLVHGGGPKINELLAQLKIESKHIKGIRVADKNTVELAEMVLCGHLAKSLVGRLQRRGVDALGVSGRDLNLFSVKPFGDMEQYGFSGSVDHVNAEKIRFLLNHNIVPIISPVGQDADGNVFMLDADHLAAKIAIALNADKLFIITNTDGVLQDPNDPASLLTHMTLDSATAYLASPIPFGGMIPKLESAIDVLKSSPTTVHIFSCQQPKLLIQNTTETEHVGTLMIKAFN